VGGRSHAWVVTLFIGSHFRLGGHPRSYMGALSPVGGGEVDGLPLLLPVGAHHRPWVLVIHRWGVIVVRVGGRCREGH
jgi:hypothetical protein